MPGHFEENQLLNPEFRDMLSAFREESEEMVEFFVIGAYALPFHGFPRATGDIDLWVRRPNENAERVWRALTLRGALA